MLEAVNSLLQTAPLTRGAAEQVSTVDSYAANPERTQRAAPQAPYVSPYVHLDINHNKAVLQIRDSDTGDVLRQFPSEPSLQSRSVETAARDRVAQQQQQEAPIQRTAQAASAVGPAASNAAAIQAVSSAPEQTSAASAGFARQIAAFVSAAQSGVTSAGSSETLTVLA